MTEYCRVEYSLLIDMRRPCMTREQIAKLVVGQEVQIGNGSYGDKGKVVKITDNEVEVLVPAAKEEDLLQAVSNIGWTPEEQKRIVAKNKPTLFRFDKDGHETRESVNDRGFGIDPDCDNWALVQDEKVN